MWKYRVEVVRDYETTQKKLFDTEDEAMAFCSKCLDESDEKSGTDSRVSADSDINNTKYKNICYLTKVWC